MTPPTTVVLQSSAEHWTEGWLQACMASVRDWAMQRGYAYQHRGDALFDSLDARQRAKSQAQPVIASDLARLYWMREALENGAETVIWLDADVLVVDPAALNPPDGDFAPGREVWVQAGQNGKGFRSYRKVHNAALVARCGTPVLPYYIRAAEQILHQHRPGHMVPQLLGPKLLTALHNIAPFDVWTGVGMLSPAVAQDVLAGGGAALDQFVQDSGSWPPALNLCRSSVANGALTDPQMTQLVERSCQRFVNKSA